MPRGPAHFRKADVVRAIRAARAAGMEIGSVTIHTRTGEITVLPPQVAPKSEGDRAMDEWLAMNAAREAREKAEASQGGTARAWKYSNKVVPTKGEHEALQNLSLFGEKGGSRGHARADESTIARMLDLGWIEQLSNGRGGHPRYRITAKGTAAKERSERKRQ